MLEKNKKPDNSMTIVKLTEMDLLKMKNLGLQKENIELQRQSLFLQEALLIKDISSGLGINVQGWTFDPIQGTLSKSQVRSLPPLEHPDLPTPSAGPGTVDQKTEAQPQKTEVQVSEPKDQPETK